MTFGEFIIGLLRKSAGHSNKGKTPWSPRNLRTVEELERYIKWKRENFDTKAIVLLISAPDSDHKFELKQTFGELDKNIVFKDIEFAHLHSKSFDRLPQDGISQVRKSGKSGC